MEKIKVGLLFGGRSGEHEVSLKSANAIAPALNKDKYEVIPIGVAKDGIWYGPVKEEDIINFSQEEYRGSEVSLLPYPNTKLIPLDPNKEPIYLDIIFPIIHGTFGEDGTLQGLLELANIPYVGSGVLGSAVAMDKIFMKKIFAYHGLPQVAFTYVSRNEIEKDIEQVSKEIANTITFPMFVKPANLGSSVGIGKAKNINELKEKLLEASKYDRKVIIEEGKEVREIEVSVLGNENPLISVPGEIIPSNEFYDYKAKYLDDNSLLKIPAKLEDNLLEKLQQLAVKAYQALDCAGFARIDFFLCKDTQEIYINEINTLPGFTAISMYPKLWEYGGIKMEELLDRLISLAFSRYRDISRNLTDFNF